MIQFPKPDAEQYYKSYVIRNFDVSADESRLVFTSNMNGKLDVYAIELHDEISYPYPLTYQGQSSNFIKIDPQGRHILSGFDHDGNENYYLYALRPEGGVPFKLVEAEPTDKFFFSSLSEDGQRLYYGTSQNNPQFLNTYVLDLVTKEQKLIVEGKDATTSLLAVSPDEQNIVYGKGYSNTYGVSFVRGVDGAEACLTPSADEEQLTSNARFIDEDTIIFTTDYKAEFAYVAKYTISSGTFEALFEIPQASVSELYWHKQSRSLYALTEKGVEDALYVYALDTGSLEELELPTTVVEQLHVAQSGAVYILARGSVDPDNIYRYDAGKWTMLTRNVVLGLAREDLVSPETIRYTSFDGMEIEALLFRAKDELANGHTIFWPHGGPQYAERKHFRAMFQYLLAEGYNLFCPNFRGSTCYGRSFTKLVEREWGEGPRKDCLAGMDWLFEQGISSRDRLFVMGGSYGGYMTLLLAGRNADYFRAAVDIVGVSNLFTFVNSVPDFWKPMMDRWIGDPERDHDRFVKDSPITYLDQMVNPIFIIQGANDPRVVKAESDQIVEALRTKGVDVEYLVFEDEGHGIARTENNITACRQVAAFLKRNQG
ncbi:S9 family peptidase [Paenibacillus arenosi]|uniref:Alpha/beta fold hydrolase n=1 Tax=Paenibacillus arenosi TaxID=2774142 RepID=A0ABR9AVG6_9BACL|nr:S9 family peptidase [Paenibacillus arenosi]MBD8498090.1 alpha/beta fold hydrolase [Paenibacillus arenosi]